jgi:hypothetical protein
MLQATVLRRSWLLPFVVAGCALTAATTPICQAGDPGVKISDLGDKVRVEIGGQLFTEYYYRQSKDVPRPFFYPVIGPGGLPMTRNWPMKNVPDEEQDHPHHKSLWFTHGAVNGLDFWSDGASKGKIVHDKFTALESGDKEGVIKDQNKWEKADGTVVCTDERTCRIIPLARGCLMDFAFTIHASAGELKFGDTKEGSMAIRLAETMRLKRHNKLADGHILNSAGQRDDNTWGKRADWCEYHGPVQGQIVGVAIFDHPQNPRHPTWWHVRDYGLFAANPFGIHDFESKPDQPHVGDLTVPAGESITFRYRFYFHPGDEKEARVAEQYQAYVDSTTGK